MILDPPPTVASKPVQLAMAELSVALNALQLVIRHRGGAVLGLEEPLVIGCVDDVDVIVVGFPMEVRTRMTRMPRLHRPALTVEEAAAAVRDLFKKCVDMPPVDARCDERGLIVGVEQQREGAPVAIFNQAYFWLGAGNDDVVPIGTGVKGSSGHGRGPFAGEHSRDAAAGKVAA